MKKTTLVLLSSLLCAAAYFLFDGVTNNQKVNTITKTENTIGTIQKAATSEVSTSKIEGKSSAKAGGGSNNFKKKSSIVSSAVPLHRDYRRVFESDRREKMDEEPKADMPDMFDKVQNMIRTRDGDSEPTYQPNYKFVEYNKIKSSAKMLNKRANLNWIERGPANVGGRTRGIAVDPDDATKNTWFVGSVGGGVWKTTNGGSSWRCLTDQLPNLSTTTIVQAQSNKNILYAGTGEGFNNVDGIKGSGIFKSTDRGETWTQLAATATTSFSFVHRMVVDPANENVIVAGTSSGIYKSIDGGTTWIKKSSYGNVQDLIANPLNFNTLYGAANGKGVAKSYDAGESWFDTDNGNLSGGRMEIAISPTDTSRLYVSSDGSTSKLFGTVNGGAKWIEVVEKSGTAIDWLGGQGWYDNTIAVNPFDQNLVYIGGINLWKMDITADSSLGISSVEKDDSILIKFAFVPSSLPFENGGIGSGDDYWKTNTLTSDDYFTAEVRFGTGKSQKAARFINTTQDYQDYIDVPFEVWDVTHNRQVMVSIQDINKSGNFNLTGFNGDKIHIHNVDYNASAADVNIAKTDGIKYKNTAVVALRNAVGVTWNAATLPNMKIKINVGYLSTLFRNSTPMTDAYNQYAGTQANVHPDQHNIVCVPMDQTSKTFKMINGNDGGVSISTDGGITFKEVGDSGYNTTQFYGADKMHGAQAYFGGTQDNGTFLSDITQGNANASSRYQAILGGDGFEVVWNSKDSKKMIGSLYYNRVYRTVDGWKTGEAANKGLTDYNDETNSPFITKIAGSKQDPDLLFVVSRKGVYRSDNFAEDWVLTPVPDITSQGAYFSMVQVSISAANPQVVWAGGYMSSSGKVQVSQDGGLTFNAANNFSKSMGMLSGLDTHPTEKAAAFAVFSIQGFPKILRTTNYGNSWVDITGFSSTTSTNGFPDVATYCVVVMPYNTNIIWAGTEIGIIESIDNGVSWHYANNGFPAASIWDMKIVDDEVVVATHGRGIWSVALPELANYTPPAVTLSPRINGNVFQGSSGIVINASLRSSYDSTRVLVDGVSVYSFGVTQEKDSTLIIPSSGSGTKTFQLVSFKDGVQYKSSVVSADLVEVLAARKGYVNDFSSASTDFSGDFEINTAPGFTNGAINSPHPYVVLKEYSYSLRVPIIVASSDAVLQYDDIAIVEPGDAGSVFGDANFWDYVIVEGAKGGNWIPLLPGYDCRSDAAWLNAYTTKADGTPGMYKTHSINLLNYFNAGDQVMIRFRMLSDELEVAWGWAIDNLKIQEQLVDVKNETIPTQFELSQNYPNPFNPSTTISYSLPQESKVSMKVYNNVGELVATLVNEVKAAGVHKVNFNVTNLASGVYFYKIEAGSFVQSKKMILLK